MSEATNKLGYSVETLNASKLTSYISTVSTPEFSVRSSQMLVRAELRKFETFKAMSHLVDGDEILRNMLRSKTTRDELEKVIHSISALESVLTSLFGTTGNVEANNPRYSSQDVVRAVASAKDYSSVGVDTQLLIAACVTDVLDVFGMRQESASASWVYKHSSKLSPTMEDLIDGLIEVAVADKVKHVLSELRKKLKVDVPKRRFVIFAYTNVIHMAFRDIALALNSVTYRELWMRDILQLAARYVLNDQSQLATYGAPRSNGAVEALLQNSTVVRLAMGSYRKDYICTIPAHEVRLEAEYIARNISSLANYDVVTNVNDVVQINGYRRSQTGALVSAVINGVRKSMPDSHVYTILDHNTMGNDFVDAVNVTKRFTPLIPVLPKGTMDRFITDTVIVSEEAAFNQLRTKYTSLVLAKADISDELLHDAVAMLCEIYFVEGDGTYYPVYFIIDSDKRLKALSPSNFDHMVLNNAPLAFAAIGPLSEEVVTRPLYSSEALIVDGKFTGVWTGRKTTPLEDVTITIKDLLNDGSTDKAVGSVEIPLFGDKKALPNFTEISTTTGWSAINTLINQIADELNNSGNQKSRMQRTAWVTSVTTLLADWVNRDVAMHSLVMKSVTYFSREAQVSGMPEEFYMTHSYYYGMIALQCALEVLNAMAELNEKPVTLNENVYKLLVSPETLLSFSSLVTST